MSIQTLDQVDIATISPIAHNPGQVQWRNDVLLNGLQNLPHLLHLCLLLPLLLLQCLNPFVILVPISIQSNFGLFNISKMNLLESPQ